MSGPLFEEKTYRVPCLVMHRGSMLVGALSPEAAIEAARGADGQTAIFTIEAVESVQVIETPEEHAG